MTGVPIDEAALEKAARVLEFDSKLSYESSIKAVVSAYLEAVGATVESRPGWSRRTKLWVTSRRIVTPWKPLTDTEEER